MEYKKYREIDGEQVYCCPDEYPFDQDLIIRSSLLGDGAHIHDVNKWVSSYQCVYRKFTKLPLAKTAIQQRDRNILYNICLETERRLRAVVNEGEIGRYRKVYPE